MGRIIIPDRIAMVPAAVLVPLAMLVPLMVPATAEASADSCVWSDRQPRSCVQVKGASTYVDWARGGVDLRPRQSARGYFYVYDSRREYINFSTREATYWNQSWWHRKTYWGNLSKIKKHLPDGRKVCARFIERRGGRYVRHSPACVVIKR